jgi:hypothetical protein
MNLKSRFLKLKRSLIRFRQKLSLALQAFKYAERAQYGIIVAVHMDGSVLPSEIEQTVKLSYIRWDGKGVTSPLRFFGSSAALPRTP